MIRNFAEWWLAQEPIIKAIVLFPFVYIAHLVVNKASEYFFHIDSGDFDQDLQGEKSMKSIKRINLKLDDTAYNFVEKILPERVVWVDDRKWAKEFTWYSWFWYKLFIRIKFGLKVSKATVIYFFE